MHQKPYLANGDASANDVSEISNVIPDGTIFPFFSIIEQVISQPRWKIAL